MIYSIDFGHPELRRALADAANWLEENDVRISDCLVSEEYDDGFGAWRVRIYYTHNA